ncbi:MAG: hypothetical protein Q7R68_10985 [Nitrospirales bacterium]|nr:hypothetical protein [Nitrospirales bacterium]
MTTGATLTPPVRRMSKHERDSREHTPAQPAVLRPDLSNRSEAIQPMDRPLMKDEAEGLAFNEEVVRILIHRSDDEDLASNVTDFIAVNGIKAEVIMHDGRWLALGYLPKGIPIYTKRKYVEQLARAKMDKIKTRVEDITDSAGAGGKENHVDRFTKAVAAFSVLEDKNPKGGEWLSRLLLQRW